jgi:hypothetical protein
MMCSRRKIQLYRREHVSTNDGDSRTSEPLQRLFLYKSSDTVDPIAQVEAEKGESAALTTCGTCGDSYRPIIVTTHATEFFPLPIRSPREVTHGHVFGRASDQSANDGRRRRCGRAHVGPNQLHPTSNVVASPRERRCSMA